MDNDSINIRIEEDEGRHKKSGSKNTKREHLFSIRRLFTKINQWRVRDRKLGTMDLPFFFIVTIHYYRSTECAVSELRVGIQVK